MSKTAKKHNPRVHERSRHGHENGRANRPVYSLESLTEYLFFTPYRVEMMAMRNQRLRRPQGGWAVGCRSNVIQVTPLHADHSPYPIQVTPFHAGSHLDLSSDDRNTDPGRLTSRWVEELHPPRLGVLP